MEHGPRARGAASLSLLAALALAHHGCGARSGLLSASDGEADASRRDASRLDLARVRDGRLRDAPRSRDAPPTLLPDLKLPPTGALIYAHTETELYTLDPTTLALAKIGKFGWPASVGSDSMTDLAVSRSGVMLGISFSRVYAVNPLTAACTALASLPESFNALSFTPVAEGGELLLAGAAAGVLYVLDPLTGAAAPVGSYGGGLGSSGDIVSVKGFGTVATVTMSQGSDLLATIDPKTGAATVIGTIGYPGVYGLGYWKDTLYGFASSGMVFAIDVKTGAGTLLHATSASFWGAGVTTNAPTS